MAEVSSTFDLKPGQPAPDFELTDASGTVYRLRDAFGNRNHLIVAFVCNHCPFVVHLAERLGTFAEEVAEMGVSTVAISSNDIGKYPADAPDKMDEFAAANGWKFPYLFDESQEVARAYAAACTPDFYLFDTVFGLTYAGQFDSTRPGQGNDATGEDLMKAVENLVSGKPTPEPWFPSSGCNIKWKPGNEPDYFA